MDSHPINAAIEGLGCTSFECASPLKLQCVQCGQQPLSLSFCSFPSVSCHGLLLLLLLLFVQNCNFVLHDVVL